MSETKPHRPGFLRSLSFRLLLLTVFFVMLAEFLIWTPSVARYRKVYLEENIARAHLSMLAIETMPDKEVEKASRIKPKKESTLVSTRRSTLGGMAWDTISIRRSGLLSTMA